jgi:putative membrane protein
MVMRKTVSYLVIACFVLFCCASLQAQPDSDKKNGDQLFLQQAYKNASWLLKLGKLAHQLAASQSVRDHGRLVTEAYEKHLDEIRNLAAKKGVALPDDTDPARFNTIQYFSRRTGAELDRNYISLMIDENNDQMSLYRKEAQQGRDREIADFASRSIQRLEGDAAVAKMILANLPRPVLK